MRKVHIGKTHEWKWKQKHVCGHETLQSTLGGKRPTEEVSRLRKKLCPKCKIIAIVEDKYPEAAKEDIEFLRSVD